MQRTNNTKDLIQCHINTKITSNKWKTKGTETKNEAVMHLVII